MRLSVGWRVIREQVRPCSNKTGLFDNGLVCRRRLMRLTVGWRDV